MPEESRIDFLRAWLIKSTPNPNVLVVDDNPMDLEILCHTLAMFKCTVEGCRTVSDAISKISTGAFHLVFLDVVLGNGDAPAVVA